MWNVQSYNNIVLFVNNILEIPIKAQIIMKFIEQIFLAFVEIGAFLQKIFDWQTRMTERKIFCPTLHSIVGVTSTGNTAPRMNNP